MKVKIKFSDLRKLKDEKEYLKEKLEESNLKLDYAITNEKNLISEIKQKNNKLMENSFKLDDLTQEIKELNEENNVLSAENNKLKNLAEGLAEGLAERKMPKFWFGDGVYCEYVGWFIVRYIEKTDTTFFYSGDNENYYSESILKLTGDDEK